MSKYFLATLISGVILTILSNEWFWRPEYEKPIGIPLAVIGLTIMLVSITLLFASMIK